MNSTNQLKALLKALKFTLEDGQQEIWIKRYANHNNYSLRINFLKEEINYGNKVTLGNKTTSNFKSNENFVVLDAP